MKKVLIVTYYWPPAGGPGVQRWLKFVKYLRDFQIEPIVYVPENPSYPMLDDSFVSEVPKDIRVIKKRIFEPYAAAKLISGKQTETISSGIIAREENQNFLQRLMLYIRGNFFIPDARKFWVKPSVKFLKSFLAGEDIHTIITTGPPHSLHLIGMQLKKELDLKWVADFRDPWTQIGYHKKLKLGNYARKKHIDLEKKILNSADHIITTSFTTKKEFEDKTERPISVITNGYDKEEVFLEPEPDKLFSLAHIGSLLSDRNPKMLWKVLQELKSEVPGFNDDLQLKFAGRVSQEVIDSLDSFGLEENLKLMGYISHSEALKAQKRSQVLLLLEINSKETRGIIPGKLFEYLSARRPILAVGPEKWDVERIIHETNSGEVFQYSDYKGIKNLILAYYNQYKESQLKSKSVNTEQYSRKNLTGKLAELLSNL